MLTDLAANFPEVRQVFERASDALGKDLWFIATQATEAELNQTHNTQPVMLAVGVAVWKSGARKALFVPPGWPVIVLANIQPWFVPVHCLLKTA